MTDLRLSVFQHHAMVKQTELFYSLESSQQVVHDSTVCRPITLGGHSRVRQLQASLLQGELGGLTSPNVCLFPN